MTTESDQAIFLKDQIPAHILEEGPELVFIVVYTTSCVLARELAPETARKKAIFRGIRVFRGQIILGQPGPG